MSRLIVCLLVVVCLLLVSCQQSRTEFSDQLSESGIVLYTNFVPGHTVTTPTVGLDFEGNTTVGIDTDNIPDTWSVTFRCSHNKEFTITGSHERYRELWQHMKNRQGQEVTISYREEYRVVYDKEAEVSRHLTDFDFIDAD